jgi:hypothetical protein
MWTKPVDNRIRSLILGDSYPSKDVGQLPGVVLRVDADDALLGAVMCVFFLQADPA